MLHSHLQDVRLLQFGVSGALRKGGRKTDPMSITHPLSYCLTDEVWKSINNENDERALTSFLRASRMRVFSCPKLSLILALLLFSIIGFDD